MNELLNGAQMRAIEQQCIDSNVASGLELMERAGRGVVEAIFETWPELLLANHRALVLCGPGNNGGDGFVIARLLHQSGWKVDVYLLGDPNALPRDARETYEKWTALGAVTPLNGDAIDGYAERFPDTKVVIDALFGTGLSRGFLQLGRVQDELNYWNSASKQGVTPHVVCVDVPSGLCADSGRYLGYEQENPFDHAIMANLTVTFHRMKLGHVLADGALACGKVVVKDIGCIQPDKMAGVAQQVQCDLRMIHQLSKAQSAHKYANGAALVLSGGFGKSGAARLAARAALRVGAGVVSLGVPSNAAAEVAAQITALMMAQIEDVDALNAALEDTRLRALCLGPGLGVLRARALLRGGWRESLAIVLDADALTAFSAAPDDLFAQLTQRCVLTPHMGEFRALFPDIAAKLEGKASTGPAYSRIDAVRDASQRAGCMVLLKGPDTVIADQSGACKVHSASGPRSAPWLASAGSGDVLAGLITGLLARGLTPMDAASTAAFLHVECALEVGPGLIAEDLPEALPNVLQRLFSQV